MIRFEDAVIVQAFNDWVNGTSAIDIAKRLGVYKGTLIKKFRDMGFIGESNGDNFEHKRSGWHSQPCWNCKHALLNKDACSWARSFTPVEGWVAEPAIQKVSSGHKYTEMETYKIISCPQFEMDEHSKRYYGVKDETECESETAESV